MTCENCSHYDELNAFCWVHWDDVSTEDAYVNSCEFDDSETEEDED